MVRTNQLTIMNAKSSSAPTQLFERSIKNGPTPNRVRRFIFVPADVQAADYPETGQPSTIPTNPNEYWNLLLANRGVELNPRQSKQLMTRARIDPDMAWLPAY